MTSRLPPDLDKETRKLPPISLRLFNAVKARARQEGITLRELVVNALERYLNKE